MQLQNTETFDEVLVVAERLYKYCKENQVKTDQHQQQHEEGQESPEAQSGGSMETESNSDSEGGEIGGEQPKSQIEDDFSEEEEELDDLDVKTANSLEDAIKELASMDGYENVYVEIPDLKIDKIIIPNDVTHDGAKTYWSNWLEEARTLRRICFW